MCRLLHSADLVLAGLAMDISGAVILARGLFPSRKEIIARTRTGVKIAPPDRATTGLSDYYQIDNPTLVVSMVEDQVDGAFGVGCLIVGFTLQGVGAALALGGQNGQTGTDQAFFGLLVLLLTAALVWIAYWRGRRRFVRALIDRTTGDDARLRDACRGALDEPSGSLARRYTPESRRLPDA
jgi:hypothetical protein